MKRPAIRRRVPRASLAHVPNHPHHPRQREGDHDDTEEQTDPTRGVAVLTPGLFFTHRWFCLAGDDWAIASLTGFAGQTIRLRGRRPVITRRCAGGNLGEVTPRRLPTAHRPTVPRELGEFGISEPLHTSARRTAPLERPFISGLCERGRGRRRIHAVHLTGESTRSRMRRGARPGSRETLERARRGSGSVSGRFRARGTRTLGAHAPLGRLARPGFPFA